MRLPVVAHAAVRKLVPQITGDLRGGQRHDEVPAAVEVQQEAPEMAEIAALIARALRGRADAAVLQQVRGEVAALCARFPVY